MKESQKCPICSVRVTPSDQYPRYVCGSCYTRAADEDGRLLTFTNVALSGGFAALYRDTHEERATHICYIDGVKCRADEASFGGIVIEPYAEDI